MIYFIFLWIPILQYLYNQPFCRQRGTLFEYSERERESESSRECTCTEGNLAELCQGLPLAPKSSASSSSSKNSLSSAPAIGLSQSSQHRCCCFYAVKHIGCVVHASAAAAVVCRGPGGTTLLYVCIYTYYISRAPKTSLGQSCIKVKDTDLDQEYRLLILYLFLL